MSKINYPQVKILMVIPVYGYKQLDKFTKAISELTQNSIYTVYVNDNYKDPIPLTSTSNRAIINFYDDPENVEHKEKIVRALDIGLDYGRRNVSFKYFMRGETDDIPVDKGWDQILIDHGERLSNDGKAWASLSGVHLNVPHNNSYEENLELLTKEREKFAEGAIETEFNGGVTLFSPEVMHYPWWFRLVPDHHDILISRYLSTMAGMRHYRTKDVGFLHYSGSSRNLLSN